MTDRLSRDVQRRCGELRREGKTVREIAQILGIGSSTATKYAAQYGGKPHAAPGSSDKGSAPPNQSIDQVVDTTDIDGGVDLLKLDRFATLEELQEMAGLDPSLWVPVHYKPNSWQGFYKIMEDGVAKHQKVQLFQSKATFKRVVDESMELALLRFVREHVKPLPKPKVKSVRDCRARIGDGDEGYMVSWGMWDAHLGLYAWSPEVGADMDLDKATRRVFNSIDDMVAELQDYPISRILMPIGNDFMHFDSVRNTTTHGTHYLDTDTRYAKVYLAALRCLAYMVERATELCDDVELLYVPGNHDVTSSFTLTVALAQRFLNDPRVSTDLSMNPRKFRTHGGVILGFDHGQSVKANQYNLILATEPGVKEAWSDSTYREIQIGHRHQRWEKMYEGVTPTNGMLLRMNPALCNVDAWHHSGGLTGEPMKSVEAWRYDTLGYRGSHVTWARNDDNKNHDRYAEYDRSLDPTPPEPRMKEHGN